MYSIGVSDIRSIGNIVFVMFVLSLSLLDGKLLQTKYEKKIELVYEITRPAKEGQETTEKLPGELSETAEPRVSLELPVGLSEGFWIEKDETVYLLDSYAQKVLKLKDETVQEIPLPAAWLPGDIICLNHEIYIYDELQQELQIYNETGNCLLQCKLELENDYVKSLELVGEKVIVRTYAGKEISVKDRQTGELLVEEAEIRHVEPFGEFELSEQIGEDKEGNIYYINTNLVQPCSVLSGELSVSATSKDGDWLGEYILPVGECVYLPQRYVQVLADGRIYLLLIKKEAYELWQITLEEQAESSFKQLAKAADELETDYRWATNYRVREENISTTTKVVLSREEVEERIDAIVNYVWYLVPSAVKTSRTEIITFPRYISKIIEGYSLEEDWKIEMKGLPYCWGGSFTQYKGWGYGGGTFDKALYEWNYLAGNINTKGTYKDYTAGVDCSGFVSIVYGIKPRFSTSQLSDVGTRLRNISKLQGMDMLVSPGDHIVLFREWLDDGAMLVSEVAVRDGKTVTHPKTLNELLVFGTYQMRSPWEE